MDTAVSPETSWRRLRWPLGGALLGIVAIGGTWMAGEHQAEASCHAFASPNTEVWLALGQSNAANHAEVRYSAGSNVGAFNGRSCVTARDPLPGGDGKGGSLWTPLAQALTNERRAERVLIAVVAQAATPLADWAPGSRLHRRATETVEALERRGLRVTRILWVQGEADAILGTGGDPYRLGLSAALEPLHSRTRAPVMISLVSQCGDAASPAIRKAQARVIADEPWAFAGPDLDRIGPQGRYQRCHFGRRGHAQAVALWLAALRGTGG
jgi:hypothetical protein